MNWFEAVANERGLMQGDLIRECPVYEIEGLNEGPPPSDASVEVNEYSLDLIVLSQSCDLENEKIDQIILAQVVEWQEFCAPFLEEGKTHVKSTKFRKALVKGNVPNLSLLHRRTEEPRIEWSVVDFHRVFVLPKNFVLHVAEEKQARLRLKPPYREHLAQAYARYFMRVGLPHDARDFIKEGKLN